MGIEPTTRSICASMVLKTREATRLRSPPYCRSLSSRVTGGNGNLWLQLAQIAIALRDVLGVEMFQHGDDEAAAGG